MGTMHVRVSDHAELVAIDVALPDDAPLGSLLPKIAVSLGKVAEQNFSRVALRRDASGESLDLRKPLRELDVVPGDLLIWVWGAETTPVGDWTLADERGLPPGTSGEIAGEIAPSIPLAPLPGPPAKPSPETEAPRPRSAGAQPAAGAPADPTAGSAGGKGKARPPRTAGWSGKSRDARRSKSPPGFGDWLWNGGTFEWAPTITPLVLRRVARIGLLGGLVSAVAMLTQSAASSLPILVAALLLWTAGEGLAAILESVAEDDDRAEKPARSRERDDDAA